jgi:regulator of replication initiation timing
MSKRIADLTEENASLEADNDALRHILQEVEEERDAALRQVRRMISDRTYVCAA